MKFPIFFIIMALSTYSRADLTAALKNSVAQIKSWSEAEKWSEDLTWRKLLHFEPTTFGALESQVDGDDFFFSPEGKTDRKAELLATIDAFFSVPKTVAEKEEKAIPICRFPARYSWLKKKIAGRSVELPQVECPRFERFKNTIRGPGLSLVFSSYYLNNPSSAFGHTFLRVNKAPAQDGKRYELLDYGLNYAANRDTDNGLLYAFRGLFGMFSGTFTTTPYYYKVREYSHAESRDLWEYELNVTPETVDHLIEHVWELGPTRINYWYLSENCSYHMFSILEAADSNIDLLSRLKKYVIPSDTVQVVAQVPGLVKSVHFRPSIRTELLERAKNLNSDEINLVIKMIRNQKLAKEDLDLRSSESQAKILDTAIDYVDFKYSFEIQVEGSEILKFKSQLLNARSQINIISPPLVIEVPSLEKPHEAHGSRRMGFGSLLDQEKPFRYLFDYKFALHDQLDPVQGYPEYAQISFFNLQASIEDSSRAVALEEWTLFEVLSTLPIDGLQKDLSWRFRVSSERVRNANCDFCRWSGVSGGAGGTWSLASSPYTFIYLGLRGISGITNEKLNNNDAKLQLWAGVGPEARFRIRWTPHFIMLLEAWQKLDLQGSERVYFERGITTQYSLGESYGLRAQVKDYSFDRTATFQFFKYY